ncbi:AIR synthase-related protein [Streptomyces longwoodensis]|uniref:AIR synthase-related protein n=1 Tax=Streptomyces longwoodensis TaxID=68231 RepID=UPI003250B423
MAALAPLGAAVHVMRDTTRGGLVAALNKIARVPNVAVEIEESTVLVPQEVGPACAVLGLDLLLVANGGRQLA